MCSSGRVRGWAQAACHPIQPSGHLATTRGARRRERATPCMYALLVGVVEAVGQGLRGLRLASSGCVASCIDGRSS